MPHDSHSKPQTGPALNAAQARALGALQAAGRPLTAYEVLDALREDQPRAAPPTAYRALRRLIDLGLVHRLESLNAYTPCVHEHDAADAGASQATLFAICDDCGNVREITDAPLARRMRQLAEEGAFTPASTIIEMHGRCGGCASEGGA
ncbi:MAG: transcriptional repressor [Rhodobacteraceae bacterium]|nr:transcriptional repressor [Paracoccaceae bacterium]